MRAVIFFQFKKQFTSLKVSLYSITMGYMCIGSLSTNGIFTHLAPHTLFVMLLVTLAYEF